jgi:hypothetical protein
MADSVLFIGWNRARPGRERLALEAFQSALAFYGKAQADGRIESFEPVLLDLHGGDLNGFILIRGTAEKLAAFRASDEFRELLVRADMGVDGIGVVNGFAAEALQREIMRFHNAIPA